jgi:hypothetical protein
MPADNFMREDLTGVLLAALLFTPLLLSPGFVIGWLFDVLGFRSHGTLWRFILSVPLSISITPILNFLGGVYTGQPSLIAFYVAMGLAFIAILVFDSRKRHAEELPPKWLGLVPLVWALIVVLSGIDLQWGNRLYPSVLAFDFNVRVGIIEGITRNGLPAVNPFFYPGHFVSLRYHYFWFIGCSFVEQLGRGWVSARHSLIASDIWCGWGLMATVALYLRYFHPKAEQALWRRLAWGLGLLAVGGLDIIPNLVLYSFYWVHHAGWTPQTLEMWNESVTPFAHAALWVAHHVAGLMACLMGFLILFAAEKRRTRRRWLQVPVAALAFASSVGLSVWVSLVFAVFLTFWGLFLLYKRAFVDATILYLSGALAGIAVLPHVLRLLAAGGAGGSFLSSTVRPFMPFNLFLPSFGFSWNQIAFANFFALPLNYFLESGVFVVLAALVGRRLWRKRKSLTESESAASLMFLTSVLMSTFLRSKVILFNDLSTRGILVAQFPLLLWAVDYFRGWGRLRSYCGNSITPALAKWTRRMTVLASLGLLSTVADYVLVRAYFFLDDHSLVGRAIWFLPAQKSPYRIEASNIGARTLDMRRLYSNLGRQLPLDAHVQGSPSLWDDLYHGLYSEHQDVSWSFDCGASFGGDKDECVPLQAQLKTLYADPTAANALDIDQVCATNHIDVLVVNDFNPVFREKSSWVWRRPALVSTPMARAFLCGPRASQIAVQAGRPRAPQSALAEKVQ